jgi:hypothetical protein
MTATTSSHTVTSRRRNQELDMQANPIPTVTASRDQGARIVRTMVLELVPEHRDLDQPLFGGARRPARSAGSPGSGCSLIDAFVHALAAPEAG